MDSNNTNEKSLARLFHETSHMIHRFAHRMKRERFDPEHGQGRIIELLKKTGPLTQKDLAYFLGVRQQSLGELVHKLEEAGYVTREQMPEDKRANIVSLTDKGKAVEMSRTQMNAAFECLTGEEQEILKSYLQRICDSLKEQLPDDAVQGECPGHGPGPRVGRGPLGEEPAPHHHHCYPHNHGWRHGH